MKKLIIICAVVIFVMAMSTAFALPFPPTDPGPYPEGYVGAGGNYEIGPLGILTLNGGYILPNIPPYDAILLSWNISDAYHTINLEIGNSVSSFASGQCIVTLSSVSSYDYLVNMGFASGQCTVTLSVDALKWIEVGEPPNGTPFLAPAWSMSDTASLNISPEPATICLLGLGGLGLLRRKHSKA